MPQVFCVRANYGQYAQQFLAGGYAAIGWMANDDLSEVRTRDELVPLYKEAYPDDTSAIVIGQQVGQIARFLWEIKEGDYVITPDGDTELLHFGIMTPDPSYYYAEATDGCPYRHRRRISWNPNPLSRYQLSVPLQNTMRSSLTVFQVWQQDEFLTAIGRPELANPAPVQEYDPYKVVLDRVLQLTHKEFEILVTHLLTALGFEGSEHTGKAGDGGVDATGELNVAGLAKVKVFIQAKQYALGTKINASTVRALRQAIPFGGQGAFITTCDYTADAHKAALEPNFPRIGLINGRQLVDLLVERWEELPLEFREKLALRPGLVRL